jgi:hypothetical protein
MAKNTGNGYRRGGVISNLFETQRSAKDNAKDRRVFKSQIANQVKIPCKPDTRKLGISFFEDVRDGIIAYQTMAIAELSSIS